MPGVQATRNSVIDHTNQCPAYMQELLDRLVPGVQATQKPAIDHTDQGFAYMKELHDEPAPRCHGMSHPRIGNELQALARALPLPERAQPCAEPMGKLAAPQMIRGSHHRIVGICLAPSTICLLPRIETAEHAALHHSAHCLVHRSQPVSQVLDHFSPRSPAAASLSIHKVSQSFQKSLPIHLLLFDPFRPRPEA